MKKPRRVSLLLAALLLIVCMNGCGSSETKFLPESDIPSNESGDNIVGNHMENLQNGGVFTMQGDRMFYANPADGGCLYTALRQDSEGVKLTDFPVANLNVSGGRLIFTDISDSYVILDGETWRQSGQTHLEIANQAGGGEVRFGGRLYKMEGFKDYDGMNAPEITPIYSGTVRSPIVANGALMALADAGSADIQPVSEETPVSGAGGLGLAVYLSYDGQAMDANILLPGYPSVLGILAYPGVAYAELMSSEPGLANRIVTFGPYMAETSGSLSGFNLRDCRGFAVFVNPDDNLIYAIDPATGGIAPVSSVVCPDGFALDARGNIAFEVFAGGRTVLIVVSKDEFLINDAGKQVTPAASLGGWHTYADPYAPKSGNLASAIGDARFLFAEGGWERIIGGGTPPNMPASIGIIAPPEGSYGDSGAGGEPPENPASPGANDPANLLSEAMVVSAFEAQVLIAQGKDYSDPGISGVYTEAQYQILYDLLEVGEYKERMNNMLVEILGQDMGGGLAVTEEDALSLADPFLDATAYSEYTIDSVGIEELDLGINIADVDITVTQYVDLQRLIENLAMIFMQAVQDYPGGQEALRAEGEEHFIAWCVEVFAGAIENPEEYDLIVNGANTENVELMWDDRVGWYLVSFEGLVGSLFAQD